MSFGKNILYLWIVIHEIFVIGQTKRCVGTCPSNVRLWLTMEVLILFTRLFGMVLMLIKHMVSSVYAD